MSIEMWLVYLLLVLAATSSPGPAVLFIMTNSILHGWRKSIYAALGNILGLFCIGILTVAGLGTIIQTSEFLFNIIKYTGAAYLIYLGIKIIIQKKFDLSKLQLQNIQVISKKKMFFQAYAVAVTNPKAIAILTALFPQFIDLKEPLAVQFSILMFVFMFFSFLFLMIYALLAQKARVWLNNPRRVDIMSKTSGGIFIGFGLLLANSSNK